jgi:hypothetical protein
MEVDILYFGLNERSRLSQNLYLYGLQGLNKRRKCYKIDFRGLFRAVIQKYQRPRCSGKRRLL